MSLDPSQLTLPQIAAAVASGELRLADAEAELRRRPMAPARYQRTPPPAPRPLATEVLRALEETRRELKQATRRLVQLSNRIEGLSQLAATLQPPAPAAPVRRHRASHHDASRSRGEATPLEEADNDNELPLQLVSA